MGIQMLDYTKFMIKIIQQKYLNIFLNEFGQFDHFNPKHPVYREIASDLLRDHNLVVTEKNLCHSVLRNKLKILDQDDKYSIRDSMSSPSSSISSNYSENPNYTIKMQKSEWMKIKPTVTNVKNTLKGKKKIYGMGIKGWDSVIHKLIEDQLDIDCCMRYSFNSLSIFAKSSCRECLGRLEFMTPEEQDEDVIRITVKIIHPLNNSLHKKFYKRKVKEIDREKIGEETKSMTALQYHERCLVSDKQAIKKSSIPELSTVRKIKSQFRLKEKLADDEVMSLRLLNNSTDFHNNIKFLSLIPSYTNIFWSDSQIQIIKNTSEYFLEIDATGSIVRSPFYSEKDKYEVTMLKEKPVFLYLLLLKDIHQEKSIIVSQMLSQNHGTDCTLNWLNTFFRNVKTRPFEIRMDCSSMLLLAASKAFNGCTTAEYLEKVYNSMEQNKCLVKTIIRFDKSHVVKLFSKWKVWIETKCGMKVKKFYVNLLKCFMVEESFTKLQAISFNLAYVMLSEYESKKQRKCFEILNDYLHQKSNGGMDDDENEGSEPESNNDINPLCEIDDEFEDSWFLKIINSVESDILGAKACTKKRINNLFFLPEFKKDLLRIMRLVPLWSNILKPICVHFEDVCTTSHIESEFNIIKNNIFFGMRLPIRNDIFFKRFIQHVQAQIIQYEHNNEKKAAASTLPLKIKLNKKSKEKSRSILRFNETVLTNDDVIEENWMNLNSQKNDKEKKSLDLSYRMRPNTFTIENDKILITNTCRINALIHGFLYMEQKGNVISQFCEQNDFFSLILLIFEQKGERLINERFYKIIIDYKLHLQLKDGEVNCFGNLDDALNKLLPQTINNKCSNCGKNIKISALLCKFTKISDLTAKLDDSIMKCIKSSNCSNKKCKAGVEPIIKSFIAVETVLGNNQKICVNDIPKNVIIFGSSFKLDFIVIHHASHFTCLTIDNLLEYDCLSFPLAPIQRNDQYNIKPAVLIFSKDV